MRVFNKDKTIELKEYDLNLGYLEDDKIITHHEAEIIHHEAVEDTEEQGHYEIIAEYPNGGKDVEWIIDIPRAEAKEAYDEVLKEAYDDTENIQIYIPYTEEKLIQNKINELKQKLYITDYQAIKYAEGWFTEEEYAPIKAYREDIRKEIRKLEIN